MDVYILDHVIVGGDYDVLRTLGIFSCKKNAMNAIDNLRNQPYYINYGDLIDPEHPDSDLLSGFWLNKYVVDRRCSTSGFVTVDY